MYLKRKEKLGKLGKYKSIISSDVELTSITPNEDGVWINRRSKVFETFIPMEPDSKFNLHTKSVFVLNSRGLETSGDVWSYNFSKQALSNIFGLLLLFLIPKFRRPKMLWQKIPI